ncbi:unnamed protein product [Sphagnum jensenii]|uniref:F-box domain-containing protein n=1 Tax=Sphagnum jensenii TaxID=128206 RepID=A0ABP0WTG3_9BRYO
MRRSKGQGNKIEFWRAASGAGDVTSGLTDEILSRILRLLPPSSNYSLVCKRWMRLHGLLRFSIKVQDWTFLETGRMSIRFPNLTDVDLTPAASAVSLPGSSSIFLTHQGLTVQLGFNAVDRASIERCIEEQQLSPARLDKGLKILADTYPGLQRLCVVDVRRRRSSRTSCKGGADGFVVAVEGLREVAAVDNCFDFIPVDCKNREEEPGDNEANLGFNLGDELLYKAEKRENSTATWTATQQLSYMKEKSWTEAGISSIARNCPLLQELELHQCTDDTLRAISACENLQIVRLKGSISGFYHCSFTDIGLTILSHTFRRLVRLELSGCEASYEGISAIGKSCAMMEELSLSNKGFYEGWIAALSFLTCLKSLKLEGCKQIDPNPGPIQHLGQCKAIDRLQFVRCGLRDRVGFAALLAVCASTKELEFQDCWGLDDESFSLAAKCRRLRLLGLAGCSLITTAGLAVVLQACKDLQRLRVTYCDNIQYLELTSTLCDQLLSLMEFSWRPDTKSVLAQGLAGARVGQKSGRFFARRG